MSTDGPLLTLGSDKVVLGAGHTYLISYSITAVNSSSFNASFTSTYEHGYGFFTPNMVTVSGVQRSADNYAASASGSFIIPDDGIGGSLSIDIIATPGYENIDFCSTLTVLCIK
jgi:hypothetical protein